MRRILLLTAVLASACSSSTDDSPDYAEPFAGSWNGTFTETDTSTGVVLGTGPSLAQFYDLSRTDFKLNNACPDSVGGPTLQATSATAFSSVAPQSCQVAASEDCDSVVVTWQSVSGSLTTTLQFTASLTFVGCGVTQAVSAAFVDGVRQ